MDGLAYFPSPIGDLQVTSLDEKITGVQFCDAPRQEQKVTPVIEQCLKELDEYFSRGRKFLTLTCTWRELRFRTRCGLNS